MNQLIDYNGSPTSIPSTSVWEEKRAAVLQAMQEIMGPLPGADKRCALDLHIEEEIDCGSYVRRAISYASEPNARTPAYLLVPNPALEQGVKCPAALCLHPTDDKVGNKVVVGLGGKENRQYASELAERGFVCLAPSYPLLADYQPDLESLWYQSGTMKAIWDNVRGLDLLESLPYVVPDKFGAIGHSLGGHNAIYTACFDQRIAAVASSCGFDSFADYMDGDIRGWTSTRYMPSLKDYAAETPFDFHDLIAALAPRLCFVSAPLHDSNFKWKSVEKVTEAAGRIYVLYSAAENLKVDYPDCGHDFPDAMREKAYRLFSEVLAI
tara:strand:- start:195 stop:1166 length:972 start_codon:yes stop_codon:yes gene_type:complete